MQYDNDVITWLRRMDVVLIDDKRAIMIVILQLLSIICQKKNLKESDKKTLSIYVIKCYKKNRVK